MQDTSSHTSSVNIVVSAPQKPSFAITSDQRASVPCMAEILHVADVAVDVGDTSAALSLISQEAVPDGHAREVSGRSHAKETDGETSSLLHGDKAAAITANSAEGRHVPWFAWPLLVASLIAVSSAAVVFASIPDVPTFTLAAWRLQLTTCLLSPAAIYQYLQLTAGIVTHTHISDVHSIDLIKEATAANVHDMQLKLLCLLQMTGSVL